MVGIALAIRRYVVQCPFAGFRRIRHKRQLFLRRTFP